MADNPQPNAPLPDPDGAGGEVVSEDDLDALLVEASQLASEISGEVRGAPADATPLSAENEPSDLSSPLAGDDIDSQLENCHLVLVEALAGDVIEAHSEAVIGALKCFQGLVA